MVSPKHDVHRHAFQNCLTDFQEFQGECIPATEIKQHDFTGLRVAVIGANQDSVAQLDRICQQATSVQVFQIAPHFVLPSTERGIHRLISHPLVFKNRRLFNNRVKNILALRFLDAQVKNTWLKHQLTPNIADTHQHYFKSDHYYLALQRENCHLITWPIVKVCANSVHSINGQEHIIDTIITTF